MPLQVAQPLKNRDYRLLWAAQAISHTGNGITLVALSIQALELSPSAGALSSVLLARTVPLLALLLVGGAITDRLPRRLIMICSDVVRGIAVALIAILGGLDLLQLWHLIVLSAIFGAGDAFFFPAVSALLPELVAPEDLVGANALDSATRPLTSRMLGPAIGGVLVASIGAPVAFGLDAASFVLSAACLLAIRSRPTPTSTPEQADPFGVSTTRRTLQDIADGFRYTKSQAWIWATLLMAAIAVLCFGGPFDVLVPLLAKEQLGGASAYGMILASMGAGGIIGAFAAPRVCRGRRLTRMYVIWGLGVIPFACIAFADSVVVAMALVALVGFCFEIGHVIWTTLLQELVPSNFQGRVRSLDYMVSFALVPLSYLLVAPITSVFDVRPTIFVGGMLATTVTFVFMLYPNVLAPDRPGFTSEDLCS